MCKIILREVSNLIRLGLTICTGVMFAASVGPYSYMLMGTPENQAVFSSLGVSVLSAGVGVGRNAQSTVYWSDLNTDNVCQLGSEIRDQWAVPNGMCGPCNESPEIGCFQVPSDTQYKITITFLTIALAALLALTQLIDFLLCGTLYLCWPLEVILALLLMISAVLTFPFWTTTGLQKTLASGEGGVVPVWLTVAGSNEPILLPSEPVLMETNIGYNLMCAGLAFAILGVLALALPSGKKDGKAPPPPKKQRCGAFCCCATKPAAGRDRAASVPKAAAAPTPLESTGPAPPVVDPTQQHAIDKV